MSDKPKKKTIKTMVSLVRIHIFLIKKKWGSCHIQKKGGLGFFGVWFKDNVGFCTCKQRQRRNNFQWKRENVQRMNTPLHQSKKRYEAH